MRKRFLLVIVMIMIGFFPATQVTVNAADGVTTGWYKEGNNWYYRDSQGKLYYGWHDIGEKRYYFDPVNAYMYSGGWRYVEASGKEYYFTSSGDAYTGWYEDTAIGEKFYFKEGQYFTGWLASDGNWYYFDNGRMMHDKDVYTINGLHYGFKENGIMRKSWYEKRTTLEDGTVDVDWYYYVESGQAVEGWKEVGGIPYYFINGWLVDDGVRYIGEAGITYGFNSDGTKMTSKWYYDKWYNEWYYFNEDGTGRTGWVGNGNNTWYYCVNGKMLRNCWYKTGENEYSHFDSNGVWTGTSSTPGK